MPVNQVVLASGNAGKLKEMQQLLSPFAFECVPLAHWTSAGAEEVGHSFVENALLKARHAAACAGLPALADDSGLCVPALGGAPGLYSARFAGQVATMTDNINKLLDAMQGTDDRRAFFHCTVVWLRDANDVAPWVCQGVWQGEIASRPTGEGGFGYDPVFYCPELGMTAAQMSPMQKNARSHRGRALRQLIQCLAAQR